MAASRQVGQLLRRAQAATALRASFQRRSGAPSLASSQDLDDLILENKTRPSALLLGFEVLGGVLGTVSFALPKPFSAALTSVVEDATEQALNDGIRELPASDSMADIRETFKYHRDWRSSNTTTTSEESGAFHPQVDAFKTTASMGLARIVKISDMV